MTILRIFLLLAVAFIQPCFAADAVEWLAVAKVENAKNIVLEDGRTVRLAAIQAPNLARDKAEQDEPQALAAKEKMESLLAGKKIRLELVSDKPDRKGRVIALGYNDKDELLQAELLRAGFAWVYTFPDSATLAVKFLPFEKEARAEKRGVWGEKTYKILTPEETPKHAGEFRLVEGKVLEVAEKRGRWFLNFGADWKTDFTLTIEPRDAKNFTPEMINRFKGKNVRVRGWLFEKNGPAMELTHPEQVEVIGARVS